MIANMRDFLGVTRRYPARPELALCNGSSQLQFACSDVPRLVFGCGWRAGRLPPESLNCLYGSSGLDLDDKAQAPKGVSWESQDCQRSRTSKIGLTAASCTNPFTNDMQKAPSETGRGL